MVFATVFAATASTACAQAAAARSPATAPALGRVVAGTSTTVFSVAIDGSVSRASGNAVRLTAGATTSPTITISCAGVACALQDIRVTVTASGSTGAASISRFRVGTLTGGTYRTSAPAEAGSLTLVLRPIGVGGSASFPLGMDVTVSPGSTGNSSYTYTVTAVLI